MRTDPRERARQQNPQHKGPRDATRENRKDRGIHTPGTTRLRKSASR